MAYSDSELILNTEGAIYHLNLLPEHVAPIIFTVGDPERVGEVSKHFDKIEVKRQHREFVTHTGTLRGQRVMVISTGIGTDNIDIVLTELDALVNIDFATRQPKKELTALTIVRLGTSGSLQASLDVDSFVVSEKAVGFDNLMHFYDAPQTSDELNLADQLADYLEAKSEDLILMPYVFSVDKKLCQLFDNEQFKKGITVTSCGFYAPQGRVLRGGNVEPKLVQLLSQFKIKNAALTNMEMETAGIYGLSRLLGHRAVSISVILANRLDGRFSANPHASIQKLIKTVLEIVV
ncbi:MAG: nucleoside phosphorylase [Saprospiraceae bacterium]|nr:nucleoside phosphorylase [Saprospiraceae bacterium]